MTKECRHLTALRTSLVNVLGAEAAKAVLTGLDDLADSASKAKKSQWALATTDRLDALLDGTRPLQRCGHLYQDGEDVFAVLEEGHCSCSALQALETPISPTWCHCCKGSIASVLQEVFPDRQCRIEILETYSAGGQKCLMKIGYL